MSSRIKDEYLKRYVEKPKEKKSRKESQPKGLIIVDQDVKVKPKTEKDVNEEYKPVVVEGIKEIKQPTFKLGQRRDGSGWVVVDDEQTKQKDKPDVSGDLSPERKRHDSPDRDLSPARRKRHDSDQDLSPVRKRERDLSPPRRRHDSDEDLSPPRNRDLSPARRKRHDSDGDLSPPRKNARSPPRKRDLSPPRRGRDLSPPRKKSREEPQKSTGLLSSADLERDARRKLREQDARFAKADPKDLGKGAQTVYRDKHGKKLSINEIIQKESGKFGDNEEDGMEWGKGLVQKKDKDAKRKMEEEIMQKPFAVAPDDPELDLHFRGIDRWGDPMAHLKGKSADVGTEQAATTEPKIDPTISKKHLVTTNYLKLKGLSKERRWKGPPAHNRFNILPGPLWDGVDRSNGFEKKYLSGEANKVAKNEQAYLWSVEDM